MNTIPIEERERAERMIDLHQPVTAIALDEFLVEAIAATRDYAGAVVAEGRAMLHAARGIGKTQVAIGAAWAVALAVGFCDGGARQHGEFCFSTERCPAPI